MPINLHENHLNTDHLTFSSNQLSLTNTPDKLVKHLRATVDFETTSPHTVGTVPLGAIITKVIVKTTTAFNGTSPTIDLGVSGSTSKYLYNGNYSITTANTYIAHMHEREIAQTDILADIFIDGSTAGVAEIYVEYAIT